jgi:hypothetical protein
MLCLIASALLSLLLIDVFGAGVLKTAFVLLLLVLSLGLLLTMGVQFHGFFIRCSTFPALIVYLPTVMLVLSSDRPNNKQPPNTTTSTTLTLRSSSAS